MNTEKFPPYPSVNRATMAELYGFSNPKAFVKYVEEYFPECSKELKAAGWKPELKESFLPAWTEMIFKHLGYPKYKPVTLRELSAVYGEPTTVLLKKVVERLEPLKKKLTALGWRPNSTRLLPVWTEVFIEYLGKPETISSIEQNIKLTTPRVRKRRLTKPYNKRNN